MTLNGSYCLYVIILIYYYFFNNPVWIAHYNENENYQNMHDMWQLCDDGKIDGVEGFVDIDIMYGS